MMRINRTLLDDVEEVYFSIPCLAVYQCTDCKNEKLCITIIYLLKSLKKHYKGNEIIQKIY